MNWGSVLALAAAASTDCFIIGFNYGVKGVRIGGISNAFLSIICFLGTMLSMVVGRSVGLVLHPSVSSVVGGVLFLALGLWMLLSSLRSHRKDTRQRYSENPEIVDKDASKVIELRESFFIGLLLCLNNIGIGIGGGIAGLSIFATPAACALLSFLFIKVGCCVGKRIVDKRLSRILEAASALLIVALGLLEILSILG